MNIVIKAGLCLHVLLGSMLYSMEFVALRELQALQDEALEQNICDSFIQAIESKKVLTGTIATPKRLSTRPAQLLAHVFITKGLTHALVTDESVPSEHSPLISFSPTTATEIYQNPTLEQVADTSNERLAALKKNMSEASLGRILGLYEGAFSRLASVQPTLYSAALCWSVSSSNLPINAVQCFDEYCYQTGKDLWAAWKKQKNSCCCTML